MYYQYIDKRTELLYRIILNQDVEEELKRVNKEIYTRSKPAIYGGKKGVLLKIKKDFELNCAYLRQTTNSDPKKLTVVEFYQAISLVEKQKNNGKKSKRVKKSK